MIDIEEIAKILTLNHGKNIFYNIIKEEWLIFTNIEYIRAEYLNNQKIIHFIKHQKDYVPLFSYEDDILMDDIKIYFSKYNDIKNKIEGNLTVTRFIKLIKSDEVLFNSWISYFINSISFEVHHWVNDYNLIEKECPKNIYASIRDLFIKVMNKEVYRYIPDNQLFIIEKGYDMCGLSIMGNAEVTYGLSFYLMDNFEEYYKYLHSADTSITDFSLSEQLALYLEKEEEKPFEKNGYINPFGDDGLVTSMYTNIRIQYECYIPYSVGLKLVSYLKTIYEQLIRFIESKEFKNFDVDKYHKIYLNDKGFEVFDIKGKEIYPETYFYDFIKDSPKKFTNIKIDNNKHYEIALKRATAYVDSHISSRITYIIYLLFIVDKDTGKIVTTLTNKHYDTNPFDDLLEELDEFLNNNVIAKNLYVDTFLDFTYISEVFYYIVQSKKIKLNIVEKENMLIESIFEDFDKQLNNIDKDFDA